MSGYDPSPEGALREIRMWATTKYRMSTSDFEVALAAHNEGVRDELRAALEGDSVRSVVLAIHRPEPARYYGTDLNPNNEFDCAGCGEGKPWPCRTARAVGAQNE